MKRDIFGFSVVRRLRQSPYFAFLLAVLLCGILAGSFTGMHIPQAEGNYVQELAALVSKNAAGKMPSLRTVLVCMAYSYGWLLLELLLGMMLGRMLWLSLLIAIRGFLLSFAVAAALAESGLWGIYVSIVSIGIAAVFWLPAMLLTGTAVLDAGQQRDRNGYLSSLAQNRGVIILSMLLLLGMIFWKLLAVPVLLGLM